MSGQELIGIVAFAGNVPVVMAGVTTAFAGLIWLFDDALLPSVEFDARCAGDAVWVGQDDD